jgi:hypothetical protein
LEAVVNSDADIEPYKAVESVESRPFVKKALSKQARGLAMAQKLHARRTSLAQYNIPIELERYDD